MRSLFHKLRAHLFRVNEDETGAVAAEFAVTVPAVVLVLGFVLGAVGTQSTGVLLQDAAADAARLIARGESFSQASATVNRAVPGAGLRIQPSGDLVCATASTRAELMFGIGVNLAAESCALAGGL